MSFKLAEMFVEIQGQDQPFQAVLTNVQAKASTMASALGVGIGTAFSKALGPIGLVVEGVQALFNMVEDGNEDVQKLGEYWEEATTPIKTVLTEAVTQTTAWVASLIELLKSNEQVIAGFKSLQEYGEAAMENVKIAIDRAVEVFGQLKSAAESAFTQALQLANDFGNSIATTFGGSIGTVQEWGNAIQEWVVDKLGTAGVIIRNWPEFFEIAKLSIQEKMMNIGEYISVLPANLAIIGNYVANNWRALIVDAISAVGTAFNNLGDNLGRLGYAISQFVQNPTKGFNFEWKPLLDGFKATAERMPELLKPPLTDMSDQIQAVQDRIAAREIAGYAKHKAAMAAFDDGDDVAKAAAGGAFKSTTMGVAEFAAKARENILGGGKDKIPAEQLKEQKEANKLLTKIADKKGKAVLG